MRLTLLPLCALLLLTAAPAAAVPLHFTTDTTEPWVLQAPGALPFGFPLIVMRQSLEAMNGVPIGDGRINMGLAGGNVSLFLEGDRSGNTVGVILMAILPPGVHTCQAPGLCDYTYDGLGKLRDIDGFVARAVGPWVPDALVPMELAIHQTLVGGGLTRTTVDLWVWKPEDPGAPLEATPEPVTLLLMGGTLAALGWRARRGR